MIDQIFILNFGPKFFFSDRYLSDSFLGLKMSGPKICFDF